MATKKTTVKEVKKEVKTEEVVKESLTTEKKEKMSAGKYVFINTYCGTKGIYIRNKIYTLTADDAEFFKKDIKHVN